MSEELNSVEAVARWEAEWLANPNHDPWGDVLSWDAARKVAERLDQERAALRAASEGRVVAYHYKVREYGKVVSYSFEYAENRRLELRDNEIETPLYARPAPSDQKKLLIGELADALEDARNNGFGEAFFRSHVDELLTRARNLGDTK